MTGQRPGGKPTPPHAAWVTTGLQWHCTLITGEDCDGSNGGFEDDARGVWAGARAHRDANPGPEHRIVVDRWQRAEVGSP